MSNYYACPTCSNMNDNPFHCEFCDLDAKRHTGTKDCSNCRDVKEENGTTCSGIYAEEHV